MSEHREPDSSLLSPVLSTSHTESESQYTEQWPLLSILAPRVIDETLDFKDPLGTIEMSLRNAH